VFDEVFRPMLAGKIQEVTGVYNAHATHQSNSETPSNQPQTWIKIDESPGLHRFAVDDKGLFSI
jgi:hypothetical protein